MNPKPAQLPPLPGPPPRATRAGDWLQIDPLLCVLGAGPHLQRRLALGQGPVRLQQGRLQLGPQQAALDRAVQTLLVQPAAKPLGLLLQRQGRPPLTLGLYRSAMPPQTLWLHIVWPEQLQLDGALLASMFGLTAAEQRVALSVAEGRSTRGTAELLGVQENTVRGHIKQLLAKTHTQRQAELAALLWRSAAVMSVDNDAHHPPQPGGGPPATARPYPNGSGQPEPGC